MAIITTSGLITNIRGSIGGTTFQRSGGGLSARNKPISVGRGTTAQLTVRHINAQLNFSWTNLLQSQRDVWSSFAVFNNGQGITNTGRKSANTGKTQFFAVNMWCLQYSKPIVVTPQFVPPEQAFIPCPPLFIESDNLMNYVGNLDTTQQILVTRISLPQSLSTLTANTGFRTLIFNQIDGDEQDWASAYVKVYGIPLVGQKKYWISLQVVNYVTGAISPITKQLVLFTAITPTEGIGFMVIGTTFIVD